MDPINIRGAGPSGLTAAVLLARAGREVVYERAPDVGCRRHGDLEAFENWTTPEDVWDLYTR
jgi:flavin-dependent dehydrogenase